MYYTENNIEKIQNLVRERDDIELTNLDKVFQVIVKSAIFEFLYKPKISTKNKFPQSVDLHPYYHKNFSNLWVPARQTLLYAIYLKAFHLCQKLYL